MLAAMTLGSKLAWLLFVDNCSVGQRGIIHNPVQCALADAENYFVTIHDCASNLGEDKIAVCIA